MTQLSLGTGIAEAIVVGDTVAVGSGVSPDTFVASQAAGTGSKTIYVKSKTPTASEAGGVPVYDAADVPLVFTAALNGATPAISITLTSNADTSKTLKIVVNGVTTTTLNNLDPSSGFVYNAAWWTGAATTYYSLVGVTLTMDSPSVGAPHRTQTTLADPAVVVNNVEYQCLAVWPGPGNSPC